MAGHGPEQGDDARREAFRKILIRDCRMTAAVADAWVREWEAEARTRGLDPGVDYWSTGLAWVMEQLQVRWQP